MTRQAAVPVALAVCLGLAAGCSDNTGLRKAPSGGLPGLIVSQPVGGASTVVGGALTRKSAAAAGGGAVYVSMVPGTVSAGLVATIRDQENGSSVTTPVVDGGFDPVAIPAGAGDTLVVEVSRSGAAGPVRDVELVRANRPPVVVRTNPPKGGWDVPLNAHILVVFSDPIDRATLDAKSVRLYRDTTVVAGIVQVADSIGLRAEFLPDSTLASATSYRLVVSPAVHDVEGMPLDSAVEVRFTTAAPPPAVRLRFTTQPTDAVAGGAISPVVVTIIDSLGNTMTTASDRVTVAHWGGWPPLLGTTTVDAVNGVATFRDLSDTVAATYRLAAFSSGLVGDTSAAFTISAGAPSKVVMGDGTPSSPVSPQYWGDGQVGLRGQQLDPYLVYVSDRYGNWVYVSDRYGPVSGVDVVWAVDSGSGTIGPLWPGAVNGVAARTLGDTVGIQTATATAPSLPGSPGVTFTAAAADAVVGVGTTDDVHQCRVGFTNPNVTVARGSTVGWHWTVCITDDDTGIAHDVTFEDDPNPPASSGVKTWGFHLRTFATPGTYRYRCTLHTQGFGTGEPETGIVSVTP